MTLLSILRAAEEMSVHPRKAVAMRLKFLMPQVVRLRKEVTTYRKRVAKACTARMRTKLEVSLHIIQDELVPLEQEAQALQDFINGKVNPQLKIGMITSEMIAQAKAVPITQVLGQQSRGGMVRCPFHKDKEPSASVRNNFLICFGGCMPKDGRKGWDTISLLMERDGLSFREAILALLR